MNLQDHIGVITKVAEVAGKEYSIEQVIVFHHTTSGLPTSPVAQLGERRNRKPVNQMLKWLESYLVLLELSQVCDT